MSTNQLPIRRGPRHVLRVAVSALAAAGVMATAAASAHAGTMRYWSCRTPAGTPTTAAGWSASNGGWNYGNISQGCASGGLLVIDAMPQIGVTANQEGMSWTFQAPVNTTIGTARLSWAGSIDTSQQDYSASVGIHLFRNTDASTGDDNLYDCENFGGTCGSLSQTETYNVSADRLGFAIDCGGSVGASCNAGNRAHVQISSAGIDLVDNSAPTAGAISGSLLANRSLAGNESLLIPLTDVGVGIADVQVNIDGTPAIARQPVDTNGGTCVPVEGGYPAPVPCKLSVTANLSVPTTVVADGTHTVTATVWDAAGNATTVLYQKVVIDNVPPPAIKPSGNANPGVENPNAPAIQGDASPGSLLTAFDGAWTDATAQLTRQWQVADSAAGPWTDIPAAIASTYRPSAAQAGKYLRIAVTAVSSQGTTVADSDARLVSQSSSGSLALTSATPSNNGAGGDPSTGRLVPSNKRTSAIVGFKATVHEAGKLVDAAGTPIVGAQIDVLETIAGGTRTKVATITTDAKGRYSWTPATRSNRVEDLAYSRQKGAVNYQSTQALQVFVRAGIHIKLAHSHIGSRGKGVITGQVRVDGFPASGVRVEVFAIGTHGNQSGGTVRTNATGKFRWAYRYTQIPHGAVDLFVKVHRDPDMPALDSTSNIVRQRIG